ncbi:MAG: efflux RND transporter periplasmic adaptor subunit [Planctomycetales bacterium]|nr:efflux RND transporter periplasmic adaptor subunit [Planctomycetales bacterium]
MNSPPTSNATGRVPLRLSLLLSVAAFAAGAIGMRWYLHSGGPPEVPQPDSHAGASRSPGGETESAGQIEFPEERWESAGIEVAPARAGAFTRTVEMTGAITLNEDQIAHIYPMVEGTVDKVSFRLGQSVKADELLLTVHSREVGQAKLDYYQAQLQLEMAEAKNNLQKEISANAKELLVALRKGESINAIETQFRNRPMGDFRERLLAAYSSYLKSQADVSRLEGLSESGAVSGAQFLTAQANRNADLATFQSRIEQIEYELKTTQLLSSQAVREADTLVAVASTSLRILGCNDAEIAEVDPAKQGETISHYSIRAPFNGTVISKDVVLSEQVRPDAMLLSIADLSTVWINADVYEEHVPLLSELENQTIELTNKAWPDRVFEAKVFYAGEIMDETTRTISMRAVASNAEHLLKPGMFVNIRIHAGSDESVVQTPLAAVQEHEGLQFVFVHVGDGKFERRAIEVGDSNDEAVAVKSGLQEGDSVVVKGGFILKSKLLAELLEEE